MKKEGHGRYQSQPQILQAKDCVSLSPKTIVLQNGFTPTLSSFQQKYIKLIEDSMNNQRQTQKKRQQQNQYEENNIINNAFEKNLSRSTQKAEFRSRYVQQYNQFSQTQGKSFTEFMESKYNQLSQDQLQMIPNSFLKTFNLSKGEQLVQDSVIENDIMNNQQTQQSQLINNSMDSSDHQLSKSQLENSPTSNSNSFFKRFQTTASMTPTAIFSRKSSSKKSFDITYGFTNTQDEKFDLKRKDGYTIKRRKKIILNQLSKEGLKTSQIISSIEAQQKMIYNLSRSKALSHQSSIDFSQQQSNVKNKISRKQSLTKSQLFDEMTQNQFLQNNSVHVTKNKSQLNEDNSTLKRNNSYEYKDRKISSYLINNQITNNDTSQHNKFILLCKYCNQQELDQNSDINNLVLCQCIGNKLKQGKQQDEIANNTQTTPINQKNQRNHQNKFSKIPERNSVTEIANRKKTNTISLPQVNQQSRRQQSFNGIEQRQSSVQPLRQQDEQINIRNKNKSFAFNQQQQLDNQFNNQSLQQKTNNKNNSQQRDCENQQFKNEKQNNENKQEFPQNYEQKNPILSEQFQKQFIKNESIVYTSHSPVQIQNSKRKQTLIQSICDGSQRQARGSFMFKPNEIPQRTQQRKDSLNFRNTRGSFMDASHVGGFQKLNQDRGYLNLRLSSQNDKRKQYLSNMMDRNSGDQINSPPIKSNTLKKILELQREMEEYESKKLVQDGQEIDLFLKKKQNQNLNEDSTTPMSNRTGRKRQDSTTTSRMSRVFVLETNKDEQSPTNSFSQYMNIEQRNEEKTSQLISPTSYLHKQDQNIKRHSQFFSASPKNRPAIKTELYEVQSQFAQAAKNNSQQNENVDSKQQINSSYQIPIIQQNQHDEDKIIDNQYLRSESLNKQKSNLNIQEIVSNNKINIDNANRSSLYIPSRIKGLSEYFKKSPSISSQAEDNQGQNTSQEKNTTEQETGSRPTTPKLGLESQKMISYEQYKDFTKKKNSMIQSSSLIEHKQGLRRNTKHHSQFIHKNQKNDDQIRRSFGKIQEQESESLYQSKEKISNDNKDENEESFSAAVYKEIMKKRKERNEQLNEQIQLAKQKEQESMNNQKQEKQKQELQDKLSQQRLRHQSSISIQQQKSLVSPAIDKRIFSPNGQSNNSKFQFPETTQPPYLNMKNEFDNKSEQNDSDNNSDKSEESETSIDGNQKQDENYETKQNKQSQSMINQNKQSNQLKLNLEELHNDTEDKFLDVCRSRQDSESRYAIPQPPTYRQSKNKDELFIPGFHKINNNSNGNGRDRRVSIYQQDIIKQAEKTNQKQIQQIGNDRDKIVLQFIYKVYNLYENETNDEEKQQILQIFNNKQDNYFYNMITNITSKKCKQNNDKNQKIDLIKELSKRLKRIFQKDNIQIPVLKDFLSNYIEYCFCELPNTKEEYFLQFKIRKSTFELIVTMLMFIFEEYDFTFEVIIQAENYLKKNYKLLCFLPSLQEEIGGTNSLSRITLKFSNKLKNKFIEMFKYIEQDYCDSDKNDLYEVDKNKNQMTNNKDQNNKDTYIQKVEVESIDFSGNDNKDSKQKQREKKYSLIESNVESHFEQVFQRKSIAQQKRLSMQSNEQQTNLINKTIEDDIFLQSKFNGKFTNEQIDELLQQILNIFRFIYNNNCYSQLDMTSMFDKSQIKSISKKFDINSDIFFEIKEILWETLNEFNIFSTTILRIQEQFERYRYVITQIPIIEALCSDQQIKNSIIREMEWRLNSEDNIMKGVFENQQTLKAFCETLIQEYIYRVKSIYNLEIFLKVLNLNDEQFTLISSQFIKSCAQVGFDEHFCQDLEIKFSKLKFKINLAISPLHLLGGFSGVKKVIQVAHNMISNPDYENEYTEYVKKFPEDLHNLLYEIPQNQIIQNSKYTKKPGLKFFEFFMFSLLSPEDCYSISDLRAGIQVFNITRTTPIHWKSLIEQSLYHLQYSESTVQCIMSQITKQFFILYQDSGEFQNHQIQASN